MPTEKLLPPSNSEAEESRVNFSGSFAKDHFSPLSSQTYIFWYTMSPLCRPFLILRKEAAGGGGQDLSLASV